MERTVEDACPYRFVPCATSSANGNATLGGSETTATEEAAKIGRGPLPAGAYPII